MDYETIFASLPDPVCVVDRTGRVVAIGPALERLLGWRLSDLSSCLLADHLAQTIPDPAQALHWTVALGQALDQGLTTELVHPAAISTGGDPATYTTVTSTASPWRDPSGQILGALLTMHPANPNATHNDLRDRFAAMAAHELSSPLANISVAVDHLSEAPDLGTPQRVRLLQILRFETQRLRRLLAQFLTAPGTPVPTSAPKTIVTIRPLIRRVVHTFELQNRHHQIAVHLPADLPFVWGDASRIQEVLSNLVDHALHLAAPESAVTLTAACMSDTVVITVATHGAAEPPAGEPPALTLQLAAGTVQALGGQLSHTCDPDAGARFLFELKSVDGTRDAEQ